MGRNIGLLSVYEMSSRGPLLDFLRKRCGAVTTSEYFPDVSPGSFVGGVISEDVQQLTFSDATFDVCTSTEVFEHVPDDMAGFRELVRVLKPGGCFIFTVPLTGALVTVERCTFVDGQLTHLHPPAYHGDRLNGAKSVLVFRDYGEDVVSRLVTAGFQTARLVKSSRTYFGYARTAIIAITPPA